LPTFRRIDEMRTTLYAMGRLDLLRDLRNGTLSPLTIYDSYRVGALERLPRGDLMAPLHATLDRFLETFVCSMKYLSPNP
jgi:hypothetical protein